MLSRLSCACILEKHVTKTDINHWSVVLFSSFCGPFYRFGMFENAYSVDLFPCGQKIRGPFFPPVADFSVAVFFRGPSYRRPLKTSGHLMPPQQHLYNGLVRPVDYSIFALRAIPCWHRNWRPHGQRAGLRSSWLAYGQLGLSMSTRDRQRDSGADKVKTECRRILFCWIFCRGRNIYATRFSSKLY